LAPHSTNLTGKLPEYRAWLRAAAERTIRRVQVKVEGRSSRAGATQWRKEQSLMGSAPPPPPWPLAITHPCSDPHSQDMKNAGVMVNHSHKEDFTGENQMILKANYVRLIWRLIMSLNGKELQCQLELLIKQGQMEVRGPLLLA
jgi:hypothetical protein